MTNVPCSKRTGTRFLDTVAPAVRNASWIPRMVFCSAGKTVFSVLQYFFVLPADLVLANRLNRSAGNFFCSSSVNNCVPTAPVEPMTPIVGFLSEDILFKYVRDAEAAQSVSAREGQIDRFWREVVCNSQIQQVRDDKYTTRQASRQRNHSG